MSTVTAQTSAASQLRLSEMLHAEMLHTVGAYQLACECISALQEGLQSAQAARERKSLRGAAAVQLDGLLASVLQSAQDCNQRMRDDLHNPHPAQATASCHPSPYPDERPPTPDMQLLYDVEDFYAVAARALQSYVDACVARREVEGKEEILGRCIAVIHDPQRRAAKPGQDPCDAAVLHRLSGRIDRMRARRQEVAKLIHHNGSSSRTPGLPRLKAESMVDEYIGADDAMLLRMIVKAFSDAHICMHEAEHLRAQSFGTMLTSIHDVDRRMRELLERSLVLNTFVYVVGRTMPWIFAADAREHQHVVLNYQACCETLSPTYCMWSASKISLLALHRRAYTFWTLGERDSAFCDFHKLTRLLRDLRQRARQRAARVPGTRTLIEGLSGSAEHHIGRIYRSQHAHRMALRYFERASLRMKGWEDYNGIGEIMKNSRWRVNLLIGEGKASYELGRIKRSVLAYARAWRAFLLLAESESHSTANVDVVADFIKWLAPIQDDPDVSKTELSARLLPLVDQFETVFGPDHLRRLAADIMMRLGHLLFILKMPPCDGMDMSDPAKLPPLPDHLLAYRCLRQAAVLDDTSTQVAADLLKVRYHAAQKAPPDHEREPLPEPMERQWPSGGGRFEETARVIEYILQKMLDKSTLAAAPSQGNSDAEQNGAGGDGPDAERVPVAEGCDRKAIARGLLASFLAHTDSSNVKLAQVYGYLMQGSRRVMHVADSASATLDIVCLRRYSSFFPFLPRPVAFRALGGGYLVQVREGRDAPFGIAIDPGPNFLDNLYRCGYSLADIQMLVITHDHADHIASLDAMLALMAIRMALGDDTFNKERRLTIVGNPSIVKRYDFYNIDQPVKENSKGEKEKRRDAVKVLSFEAIEEITALVGPERQSKIKELKLMIKPESLKIEPVRTVDHFDAAGCVSQGFMLSVGVGDDRSSVLFTGDTGPEPSPESAAQPPSAATGDVTDAAQSEPDVTVAAGESGSTRKHYLAAGGKTLKQAAAEADVVVAHLSSVPLRELRELADLQEDEDVLIQDFIKLWNEAAKQSEQGLEQVQPQGASDTRFLLKQVQFGFRTRSATDASTADRGIEVSPLSPISDIKTQSEKHLYLTGLLDLAEHMARERPRGRPPLLLVGELREELGTFRTRIASHVTEMIFQRLAPGNDSDELGKALTADVGLRVRLARSQPDAQAPPCISVLCTTCDLDNDLTPGERFHPLVHIREVCVKGENEGVFYNCLLHDPGKQPDQPWVESVERYDVFRDF